MATDSTTPSSKAYLAIPVGGLIVGVLDITSAFIVNGLKGATPTRVLQGIASGLLGPDSYKGGLKTAALGLAIHFLIATVWTTVYFVASRGLEFMIEHAIVCGVIYGVLVYLIMYGIVLRLTFHRSFFSPLSAVLTAIGIHVVCIGLPIGLVVRRYSGLSNPAASL
jgi:hypothetical protein